MKTIFLRTSLLLITFSLLINCTSQKHNKNYDNKISFPSGVWELADISSLKNIEKEFPNQLPTLIFEKNNDLIFFGNDGCNNYQADFVIRKNHFLKVKSTIETTKMLCNKVNNQLYLKNLSEVNSFDSSENILKLNTVTDTLKFYRVSLNGKWYLNKLNTTKKKLDDLFPYKKPFINIDINSNHISGFTACNSVNANILIFQNTMKFNHVTSTKMFCDGTGEKDFTNALEKVTNYELKGTRLILFEDNKIIMEFIKRYE